MKRERQNVTQLLLCAAFLILHSSFFISPAAAQIGEHRNEFAIGVSGGYVMSNVNFKPDVQQTLFGGMTGGVTFRYTTEKYFSSVCAVVAEINYAQIGWKENILSLIDEPVINAETGIAEEYQRRMNYVQIPFLARLGWGRERKGFQFFFQAGPQMGFFLNESTTANYPLDKPNMDLRASLVVKQETMPVENKFDYGITGGIGMEYSHPNIGHFMLEARYYYGLGNIYGNTKRDYFGRSNFSNIVIKASYLFDIAKTKNDKIK